MERFKRQAMLIHLMEELKSHGSWCGETHVQKSTYFLTEGLGVDLDLQFILYKHGPFSFPLREVLGEMRSNYLIDLETHGGGYGPSLVVTDSGQVLLKRFPKTVNTYEPAIQFVANALGRDTVSDLERLSTALYVLKENPERSTDQQAARINELKPHVADDQAKTALKRVEDLLSKYRAATSSSILPEANS